MIQFRDDAAVARSGKWQIRPSRHRTVFIVKPWYTFRK